MPNTLVRLIEPFVSRTADNDRDQSRDNKENKENNQNKAEPLSYVEKAALSMVLFLREACISGGSELRHQLELVSSGRIQGVYIICLF